MCSKFHIDDLRTVGGVSDNISPTANPSADSIISLDWDIKNVSKDFLHWEVQVFLFQV